MYLEFEKPLVELKEKIDRLRGAYNLGNRTVEGEMRKLQREFKEKAKKIYGKLSPWRRILLARHPKRPHTLDYVDRIFKNFQELHGDRSFAEDKAVVAGFGEFYGKKVAVIGHEKGRSTNEKIERNFGMPHPEGYRKAMRVVKLAEKYGYPVVSFIDTPGAYPGIGAEERGQSQAIAESLCTMGFVRVPTLSIVIGEGGSGGALAFGITDRVYIMENAYYSVISPEGCAAILWKDQSKVEEAAKALKITAKELLSLRVVDDVIPEPLGAAHWEPDRSARVVKCFIRRALRELSSLSPEELIAKRVEKFRNMGAYRIA